MRKIIINIELMLCAGGLLLACLALTIGLRFRNYAWKTLAVSALAVGVVNGFASLITRRRQRSIRNEIIADVRHMLKDMVNNQLTIISLHTQMPNATTEPATTQLQEIRDSVERVAEFVNALSAESLHQWKAKYRKNI